ncbi:hydroxymethylbilane synthase [Prolixibacteraceae bacterium Z1-6]|uniref:Porphobilinogen deaminase n=1 Tax=Draconibacterium aestuarii TaxID=2998507 RepID=A0A9X3J6M4_9BACT|nr:hydroxymethylbilane synthase [Prolixibacteraceae bacterium Z1-6]
MKNTIRIGTRGSKLALYQAYRVKESLEQKFPEKVFEIVIVKTKGDKILDVPLSKIGDKGLFTKELEVAMFNDEIDMAVHSLKDLPTVFPVGTKLGAVLERGTVNDALVSKNHLKISEFTAEHTVATSSLRRKAQLLKRYPNLNIVEIRGNVNTRIRKMEEGYCDAMIMAAAGLQRLEMDAYITEIIDPEVMIPACGQGAMAIEIKDNDPEIEKLVGAINHEETMITSSAERAFLNTLEGGCQIPVGSTCKIIGDQVKITGFVSSIDGSNFLKESASGPVGNARQIAIDLAKKLFAAGGKEILDSIRTENFPAQKVELPLQDKIIISTRPADANDDLPQLLKNAGSKVVSLPMIQIEPASLTSVEIDKLKNLDQFNWVIFTSKNGVASFFKQLIEINGNTTLPASLKIVVIGEKTAAELDYYGYAPHLAGEKNTSLNLINDLIDKYNPQGQNFLLVLGNLADNSIENRLSQTNVVSRINVYNTVKPAKADQKILDLVANDNYDLIIFTSPSTFNNFCYFYGTANISRLKIASIGTTTTSAIKATGVSPLITANKSNAGGLYTSIINYYQSEQK